MVLPFYCHMVIYGQDIATSTYQRNKRYCGPKRNLRHLKHVSKIKERPWRNLHDQDWNSFCFSMTHFVAGKYVHRSRTLQWNPVLRPPSLCDHLVITTIFFDPNVKITESVYCYEDPVHVTTLVLRPGFSGPTVVSLTRFHSNCFPPDNGWCKNAEKQGCSSTVVLTWLKFRESKGHKVH